MNGIELGAAIAVVAVVAILVIIGLLSVRDTRNMPTSWITKGPGESEESVRRRREFMRQMYENDPERAKRIEQNRLTDRSRRGRDA